MQLSNVEARDAEREAKAHRMRMAQLLRIDETKAPSAADVLRLRRIKAAAAERGAGFDALIAEPETNRLFECGAIYFDLT